MLFEDTVPLNMHLPIRTQPGSVTVEIMAGIFTKRIWQSYPSLFAKCPGISLQWNFQNELQLDDALLWNNTAQWLRTMGGYCYIIFPLSSMELQQLLQLEAILYALRRQDDFQRFPFNLSTILYICSQTILKQIRYEIGQAQAFGRSSGCFIYDFEFVPFEPKKLW